ncbi:hypothetical protein [Herbaspirillum seropedicae]|uniref:hypothetical protein n=1 Tax=Herbaspirillum seropedicae TaxID=964 RepID=UPI003D9709D0
MSANEMDEVQAVTAAAAQAVQEERVSAAARDGLDLLLQQALRSSLVPSGCQAAFEVLDDISHVQEKKMVVLTISSYLFRMVVMFHFTADAATRAHFAGLHQVAAAEMSEQGLLDAIAECGNLCCGIFNRELGRYFPHLGMSTPNVIDRQCAAYLQKLNCAHIRHFAIDLAELPESPRFHVSLCVSAYAPLDFAVAAEEQVDTTGELELF